MKKTTFIVGAGASSDFGLPLGASLADQIRRTLMHNLSNSHTDNLIQRAMEARLPGDYGEAAREVAGGMVSARSIDRFLDSRKDRALTVHMGKCAIAYCLLASESKSPLGSMPNCDWKTIHKHLVLCKNSWLGRLFSLLHEGVRPLDAAMVFENVSFVTFNYDRCIERYLTLVFQHVMGLSEDDTSAIVDNIPIVHVYGSLGELPNSNKDGIPFGASFDRTLDAKATINTFTEGVIDGVQDRISALVADAEQIVSLGFALDPVNVSILCRNPLGNGRRVYATNIGVDTKSQFQFKKYLGVDDVIWRSETCSEFCGSEMFAAIMQR